MQRKYDILRYYADAVFIDRVFHRQVTMSERAVSVILEFVDDGSTNLPYIAY